MPQVFLPKVDCKCIIAIIESVPRSGRYLLVVRFEDLRKIHLSICALSEALFNSTGDLAADETQLLTSKLASEKHLCFISELTNWALQR